MTDLLLVEQLRSYLTATAAERMAALARPGVAGDPTRLVERRLAENSIVAGLTPEQVQVIREGETVLVATQLAAAQVGACLTVATGTAARRVREAVDLVEELPGTLAALHNGGIDPQRARVLADRSSVLTGDLRRELENRLLADATDLTPTQWRNRIDAEVIVLDPDAAQQRHRDAVQRRRLGLDRLDDGIGRFIADLPAHEAQLVWDLFDAIGEALKGVDERTADQRRADAFLTVIEMLASGQTVSVAAILGHPHSTVHDTCHHPEHPDDVSRPQDDTGSCSDAGSEHPSKTAPQSGTTEQHDNNERPDGAELRPTPAPASDPAAASDPATAAVTESLPAPAASVATGTGSRSGANAPGGSGTGTTGSKENRSSAGDPRDLSAGSDATPEGFPKGTPGSSCDCGHWKLPSRQGRDTHTTVVVTIEALAGLTHDPARLAGHGVITADFARALAAAGRSINILVVDADGTPLAIGDRSYRPSQRLRDKISTAYQTCIFSGCSRPVDLSDNDHRITFGEQGGDTDLKNLHPLCRYHHRLKTFGGWTYRPADSGTIARNARPATTNRPATPAMPGRAATPAAFVFRSPLGFESISRVDHLVRTRTEAPPPF